MTSVLDTVITPPEWRPVPFGRLVERRKEACRPDLPPLSVFLDEGVVPRSSRQDNFNRLGSDLSKYLVVQPGDVVFNKLRTWQGGLGTSRYEGIVSPAYFVCRPVRGVVPKFLHYLLRSTTYLAELTRISKFMPPSQFDISWDDLRLVPILIPEVRTQRAIADYLDTETARIDTLISKKRHLIDLLAERRTALITQTVTRGLNPSPRLRPSSIDWLGDIPPRHRDQRRNQSPRTRNPNPPNRGLRVTNRYRSYKPSGVDWLGNIPTHWEVRRLKTVLTRNDGGVWGDQPGNEGTIVLRSTDQTIDGGWTIDDPAIRSLTSKEKTNSALKVGDLLVTKSSGSAMHIGKTSLVTDQVAELRPGFSNFMQRLRCSEELEPRIAWYLLNSPVGRQQLILRSNSTTGLANLSGRVLGELQIPFAPSFAEQRAIADYLDTETARIDALSSRVEAVIKLLQEYRTALITAAVTGTVPAPTCD